MRSVALLPSIALLAGALAGTACAGDLPFALFGLVACWCAAVVAWARRASGAAVAASTAGYALAGVLLGAVSAREALNPSIRDVLEAAYGGFTLDTLGPAAGHPPILTRVRLLDDAAVREFGVAVRARVEAVTVEGEWRGATGGVRLTISGSAAAERAALWRAGRTIQLPVTFRRPTRYLNDGVPDFERDLAFAGVALTGTVKSGFLVDIVKAGGVFDEAAAAVRAQVRDAVQRYVSVREATAGAIVTAILIGDRTALSDEIRDRLQAAGTYHVIAISGGNIAILAALIASALLAAGATGRTSALVIMAGLAVYALIVSAGPSVWRATLTAIVYLAARLLDHRSPPWNALAASAAILTCVAPLDVRDVGFALTFGATAAILEAARRHHRGAAPLSWIVATVVASFATEVVLLPITATAFSRVTVAGLVLNIVAVPLMTVTQIAGLAVVFSDHVAAPLATVCGLVAAAAARGLVESARLVDVFPWLAVRLPPPPVLSVIAYYIALGSALWLRRRRAFALLLLLASGGVVLTGVIASLRSGPPDDRLRLTMFDVGQGDAVLLQTPGGRALMVDTGGAGFDGSGFDIGGRVLAPALWARGVMRLDALAVTHGDPDHIGGAVSLVRDFTPREVWQGVPMPDHLPSQALVSAGLAAGATMRQRLAGWSTAENGAAIRVLHPPRPDWDRPRVRNDDSLVIEVRYRDVAMLLTGDIGADIERMLIPQLTPARLRILKVAHHGSRTSTSQALLDAWKPQIALISCGRGNRFGHPAPEVMRRLEAGGVRVYRTDRDGQITVDTNGTTVSVHTYVEATKQANQ